ncbi:MAG: hypothetical protein F7C38_05100 [Desulfurococcales archaeon]|nr:hypothetical protein [Desulfurococcales archaeon]
MVQIGTCDTKFIELCLNNGHCKVCRCDIDYRKFIKYLDMIEDHIEEVLINFENNKKFKNWFNRLALPYQCPFRKSTLDLIKGIKEKLEECETECNNGDLSKILKKNCPEAVYCNEDEIAKLYMIKGATFKNPDYIIISAKGLTLIIEEKENPGSRSPVKFQDQLISSYTNLPKELKKSCTFIVLIATRRSALPKGLERDKSTGFLTKVGSRGLFPVPVIYIPAGIRKYMTSS